VTTPDSSGGRALALALIGLAFLWSRLYGLTTLPIFLDETIHLRWAFNVAQGDKLFRPWADGRLLTIWLYALVLPHTRDILPAARALSAVAGGATLIALEAIGRRLVSPSCGLFAALLYVFCPFTLLYDRMALTDSFLTAAATLAFLLSLRLVEGPTLPRALLLSSCLALAVLTKFLGILIFLIPATCVLVLAPQPRRFVRPLLIVYGVAFALLLYPLFVFAGTDMLRIFTSQAQQGGLLGDALANLRQIGAYVAYYWGAGLLLLSAAGLFFSFRARSRVGLLLTLLTLVPLLIVAATMRIWFARYILWETIPVLLLAAFSLTRLVRAGVALGIGPGISAGALIALSLGPCLARDLLIILDPPRAGLPPSEDAQYVNGWPSGYGVRETVAFLQDELQKHPEGITVVTHSASRRTTWNALDLAFQDATNFDLEALDFSDPEAVSWLAQGEWSSRRPTYVLLSPRFEGGHKTLVSQRALPRIARKVRAFWKPDGTLTNEIFLLETPPGR
jgi:hypothetical protein